MEQGIAAKDSTETGTGIVMTKVSEVIVGEDRRQPKQEIVEELAKSIQTVGLLNPITILKDGTLVSGRHRLEAYKLNGIEKIPARVVELGSLERELAEDDENVIRAEYSELEKARAYQRRKEIYEKLHPDTRAGGNRQSEAQDGTEGAKTQRFTEVEKKKTGESERKIQRYCQIGKNLSKEAGDLIAGTPIANSQRELLDLGQLPEAEQLEVAKAIQNNPELRVQDARAAIKATGSNETSQAGSDKNESQPSSEQTTPSKKSRKRRGKSNTADLSSKQSASGAGQTTDPKTFPPLISSDVAARAINENDSKFVVLFPGLNHSFP